IAGAGFITLLVGADPRVRLGADTGVGPYIEGHETEKSELRTSRPISLIWFSTSSVNCGPATLTVTEPYDRPCAGSRKSDCRLPASTALMSLALANGIISPEDGAPGSPPGPGWRSRMPTTV